MGCRMGDNRFIDRAMQFHGKHCSSFSGNSRFCHTGHRLSTGRPRELVLSFLGVMLPVVVFLNFAKDIATENILIAVIITFFLTRYLLEHILSLWTVHRGLWHSIPVGILCAEIAYLLFWDADIKSRFVYTTAVLGGFLSHLILDEMYSVKILEVSAKSSFGTALKFKSRSKTQSTLLYVIIFSLGAICFLF